ncbi:MAG: 50S ribosomal protein L4 [Candidatus Bathyarchaeota archaeon]|nr:MAG: 50S ribosomal protein L4 [Candidatus Bathyarchaeota archaeon]
MGKVSSKIFDLRGKPVGKVKLPLVFKTPLRPHVVKRAVVAMQSRHFQRQGRDPMAGKRTTAESRGVGLGIARVPRMKERNRAAFGVGIVGGHLAHPPRSKKKIVKKIPKKEMRLAISSAVAATGVKETVAKRGHHVEDIPDFPLVVVDDFENLKQTKDVREVLLSLGVWGDVFRVRESRKVRAGKGKGRGRRYKQAVGPLIVVAENGGIIEAGRNLPGVQVELVDKLNIELLAPGTHVGRLTVWSNSAIERLNERFSGGD